MFGWSEGNTVNRFLNSTSAFFKNTICRMQFENVCCSCTHVYGIISNSNNMGAPHKTGEQIKHSLNTICDSEMSKMINYGLKAL